MNTFGRLLRLSSWGESHGEAIGGILDGFPAGFILDLEELQQEVDKRSPGHSPFTTARQEADKVEILSGIKDGKTLGSPIAFMIRNLGARSQDYSSVQACYRPGHADYTYQAKYGIREARGGGRSSARETAIRVVAGAIAKQWLRTKDIEILAYADAIGSVHKSSDLCTYPYDREALIASRDTLLRIPDIALAEEMQAEITRAKASGDSVGGIVACCAYGVPVGIGEPVYDKLEARLASAMLSINATRGFELGDGFRLSEQRGSFANDAMYWDTRKQVVAFRTNYSGGTLGGISTGQTIQMRVAFKPTPSIALTQETLTLDNESILLEVKGRHDPCVVPRAIPVVEAMCALVLMDMLLLHESSRVE